MDKTMIHFSMDDVIQSLRQAALSLPESIFEIPLFAKLKEWHRLHQIRVSLYVHYTDRERAFCLGQLPTKYIEQLFAENDWLRVNYHGVNDKSNYLDEKRFEQEYEAFLRLFAGRGKLAESVRFHCWQYPDGAHGKILQNGVKCLLCPEIKRDGFYHLLPEEIRIVESEGMYIKNGIQYKQTHLRFDNIDSPQEIIPYLGKNELILFGHEWRFRQKAGLLDEIFQLLDGHGFLF